MSLIMKSMKRTITLQEKNNMDVLKLQKFSRGTFSLDSACDMLKKTNAFYKHGIKLGNTFSPWAMFQKSIFLFSGDTEIFITCMSYLGLATGQFMDIHNTLSLCCGGHNVPYMKNSTFY